LEGLASGAIKYSCQVECSYQITGGEVMAGIGDIAREGGVKYEDASKVIDGIRALLKQGEKITLQDFGTFSIDVQDERVARNPQNGEEVETGSKSVPKFRFNYTFRKIIQESVPVDYEKLEKKRLRKAKLESRKK
jgi:nucleoid DNA-binding protein